MAYRLILTSRFNDDVQDIQFYLGIKVASPHAAYRFGQQLKKACETLAGFPLLHSISRNPGLARRRVREWRFDRYVILYRVENESIQLLRLLHQSRDTSRAIIE